ncbi:energy transducer TonB [Piscinibacter sp.]|uniref:energy transducer TonB n=1 Tax=Piscinibacter sp. TaxID=1903157 RepID=UPI002C93C174|nr:energy transducer TonB [Albitalea sp.]HUG26351.1 energy transducer TonB [Albitalea sp.]
MNFSKQQADPRRHAIGFSFVVLLHVLVVYALVTGLAKKVVDVVRAPIETKVIEDLVKPPPPPETVVPPPPKLEAPPPPFIPPPEVQIATPPPLQPTITATPTPPPEPVAIAPVAPPLAEPAPAAPVSAAVVCSNFKAVMGDAGFPREASRLGLEKGDALIQFTLGSGGDIRDVRAVRASHPVFARNSIRIVGGYKCQGQGRDVLVQVPFGYRLE